MEKDGVVLSKLLVELRHSTGDIAIQCDADKTISMIINGTTVSQFTKTGASSFTNGLRTKQAVNNVHDTTPTKAELTTSFGDPATIGRGFVGTVDDADGNTNGYLVFSTDTDYFFLKFTKAV